MAFSEKWQYDIDNSIAALDTTDKALKATIDLVDRKHSANYEALDERLARIEDGGVVSSGDFVERLKSRKFLSAVGSAIIAIIGMVQGTVPTELGVPAVVAVIIAFIGFEGYADAQARKKI